MLTLVLLPILRDLLESLAAFATYPIAILLAVLLLALLILREVARISPGPRWHQLTRLLTLGIAPLLIIFMATVTIRVAAAFW